MHIAHPLAHAVQHRADGEGDPAGQQQEKAGERHRLDRILQKDHDAPSHADIAGHRHLLIPLEVDRVEHHRDSGERPFHAEDRPRHRRVQLPDGAQQDRGVGAGDQEVDIAVVDDAHHALGSALRQTVIDARHRKHDQQGQSVDRARNHRPDVAVQRRDHRQQGDRRYRKDRSDDMGDHIRDLLGARIIGQLDPDRTRRASYLTVQDGSTVHLTVPLSRRRRRTAQPYRCRYGSRSWCRY